MAQATAIEWTDATWNPVHGCSKVSPGCAHCYAETLSRRYGQTPKPWTPENASENVILKPHKLKEPLKWREPRMVFVNSMSDLFHELVPDEYIDQVYDVMMRCPQHTFQILTKRPERMRSFFTALEDTPEVPEEERDRLRPVLPNVWLGVSIENRRFIHRVDVLRQTPAAIRFISAEPLLGPLAPERMFCSTCSMEGPDDRCDECEGIGDWWLDGGLRLDGIDWLIVGGESGAGHRPIKEQWVTDLRDLADDYDTAFFFKQWGGATPKSGGRELDGRIWDEMPRRLATATAE